MLRIPAQLGILRAASVFCALLGMTTAQASITDTLYQFDGGTPWAVTLHSSDPDVPNVVNENTQYGGVFHWRSDDPLDFVNGVDGSGAHVGGGTNFISFCIELTQNVAPGGTYTIDIVPVDTAPRPGSDGPGGTHSSPMGPAAAASLADLWHNYLDEAVTLGATYRAAFQLAVWKLAYDEADYANFGFDLLNGRLTAPAGGSGTVFDIAQSWLNSINPDPAHLGALANTKGTTTLYALTGANGGLAAFQDQLVEGPPPPGVGAVPETASIVTWGLLTGVIGLVVAYRRVC